MNYTQGLEYIDSLNGLGSDLGLNRIQCLMDKLDNPQDKIKVIHVAGTNGKGSCCAMLSSILIEEGYSVGVYTSPHLEEYNERYTVNGTRISNEDFAKYMSIVKEKCDELKFDGTGQPTIFEVVTALGFLYFYDKKIDYLILEVGLGGRFDATNVIKTPILSIITSISKDHVEFLGDTISQIAFEKGGIIKDNCPLVLYTQSNEVYETEKRIADGKNAKLYYAKKNGITILKKSIEKTVFNVKNEFLSYENLELSLIGKHQINNAATVLLACEALKDIGISICEPSIYNGIKNAKWSGRMEVVCQEPLTVIDGAHNIDGIDMLAKSLEEYFPGKEITLLIGILGDKEYRKMIERLLPLAARVVFTEPNNSRKWDVFALTETISDFNLEKYKEKNIEKAFDLAKSITTKDGVLCCAGSLYLIGEIYKLVKGRNCK